MTSRHSAVLLAAIGTLVIAAACAEKGPTRPGGTVLKGMVQVESNDTVVTQPPPQSPPTPGSFHGFVLGHGTGPDTMATAPRLAGVAVTAYPHLGWDGSDPIVGEAAATQTTDANGAFEFPTIPGGEYIVTFVPPASSAYGSTYVIATIHSASSEGNWWVILPLK